MKLIIDGDPLVYRAGFAAEKRTYHGVAEVSGKILEEFTAAAGEEWKNYKASLAARGGEVVFREHSVIPEPVQHALHLVQQQIGTIHATIEDAGYNIETVSVLLTGPGNFREQIATTKPYKGNRDPAHKPVHYQALRDYLTNSYNARVIHGREADDEASILAWDARRAGKPYIVASIDKDLEQIPGLHYDYMQHVLYDVSEEEARVVLWTQILAGDGGDNVPGAQGWGSIKARRLIQRLIDYGHDDLALWNAIVIRHRNEDRALETARLVYMLQRPGEVWYPEGARIEGGNFDD